MSEYSIKVNLTEQDLDELRYGKHFHWNWHTEEDEDIKIKVHLYQAEEDEE